MDYHPKHPLLVFLVAAVFFAVIVVFANDKTEDVETVDRTQTTVETEKEALIDTTDIRPSHSDCVEEGSPFMVPCDDTTDPVKEVEQASTDIQVLSCTDCWLAPVSKQYSLTSSYSPSVVELNVNGGGSLVAEAAAALSDLFEQANDDGISMYVRSAYRSYSTQQVTFEKWVGQEMAAGLSRAEAEAQANTYSARPGQSEHQLGTSVDLLCTGAGFDSTPCNEEVWQWLADNMADYGFALSYPEGKEAITGYTFEPWHYRYIGIDNAQEYTSQSSQTLYEWLLARY